ncbi:MAG: hypothetical protein KAY24_18330, partial [Candidatus Eisenbacteria sp.]|nr:hypothetical protein [Candidatus Eisenbacteria bacterium]
PPNPGNAGPATLLLLGEPNPAITDLRLSFQLDRTGDVSVEIYNCAGRRVADLCSDHRAPGKHCLVWHGRNDRGQPVAAGTYWALLRTPWGRSSREIVWLR